MALPRGVDQLILKERDVLGLKMTNGSDPRIYWFRVLTRSYPVNLFEFSLGAATGYDTDGTGVNAINDSTGNNSQLQPAQNGEIIQGFWGVTPTPARIYLSYPQNTQRLNLRSLRTVGGDVGYIDGNISPLRSPDCSTEFFATNGLSPSFNGYNPQAVPNSITIRMTFYLARLIVDYLGITDELLKPMRQGQGKPPTAEDIKTGRVKTMGGADSLIRAPQWFVDKVAGSA
jgi:hypothetical protein